MRSEPAGDRNSNTHDEGREHTTSTIQSGETPVPLPTTRSGLFDPPAAPGRLREEEPIRRLTFPGGEVGWLVTDVAEPGGIEKAAEELLRYLTVNQLDAHTRTAREDVELGGVRIAEGERVRISLPAANRDLARFEDPDALDIARLAVPADEVPTPLGSAPLYSPNRLPVAW